MNATVPSVTLAPWKKLLFSLIVVLLVLGVLEGAANVYLRVTRGYDGEHLYQYVFDPYKNILPTPGFVDTRGIEHNAAGFRRSADVQLQKPDGVYRVFLMGGSTAYGLGGLWPHIQTAFAVLDNDQTIDAYLERRLQEALPDVQVEVINAAITSTWTHHSLIYINQSILRYDPDMILLLDGFNDFFFTDSTHDQFRSYAYGMPSRIIMGEPTVYAFVYSNAWWFFRRSALFHVLGRTFEKIQLALKDPGDRRPLDVAAELDGLSKVFPQNALAMHRRIGLILEDAGVEAVFMLQPLLALERDKPMPPVERQMFDFNLEAWLPNYEAFIHAARDTVAVYEQAMASEVGGHFLDLTEIYRTFSGQAFTDYAHLTPEGNAILADTIAAALVPSIRASLAHRSEDR